MTCLELPELPAAFAVDGFVPGLRRAVDPVPEDVDAELPGLRVLWVHLGLNRVEKAIVGALTIPFQPENEEQPNCFYSTRPDFSRNFKVQKRSLAIFN